MSECTSAEKKKKAFNPNWVNCVFKSDSIKVFNLHFYQRRWQRDHRHLISCYWKLFLQRRRRINPPPKKATHYHLVSGLHSKILILDFYTCCRLSTSFHVAHRGVDLPTCTRPCCDGEESKLLQVDFTRPWNYLNFCPLCSTHTHTHTHTHHHHHHHHHVHLHGWTHMQIYHFFPFLYSVLVCVCVCVCVCVVEGDCVLFCILLYVLHFISVWVCTHASRGL